jgi:hypothetical protein
MGKFLKKKEEVEKSAEQKADESIFNAFRKMHGNPFTRREMLASGLIPFAASFAMPSWMRLFANAGVAQAEDLICTKEGSSLPAFIQIKVNGGFAAGMNFVANAAGGQMVQDFSKYGGGTAANLPLVTEFANKAQFYSQSQFLAGVRAGVGAMGLNTLAKSVFVGVPCRIGDDSQVQKLGLVGAVSKAELAGTILPAMGVEATATGLQATAAINPGTEPPLRVGRQEDIAGSLGVSGVLAGLSQTQKEKLFRTIQNVTTAQTASLKGLNGAQTLSRLIQCANISNTNLISNPANLNISPLANAQFATLWGLTANTATSAQNYVFGSMVWNALNGNAGAVGLSMGGYDYHDGTRSSGDAKDNALGMVVGRALQSMALLQKAGFIVVCTDGAVTSAISSTPGQPWTSDGGGTSCIYAIYYDPTRNVTTNGFQIGQMTSKGVADESFITGGNPEMAAGAVLLNYLSVAYGAQAVTRFESVAGNRPFSPDQIDKILTIKAA